MPVRSPRTGTTHPGSAGPPPSRASARSAWSSYAVASSAARWSWERSCPPEASPESSSADNWSPAIVSGRTSVTGPQEPASALPSPASSAGWPR